METIIEHTDPVLLIGEGDLTASVAVCLLNAGHKLDVYTPDKRAFNEVFNMHINSQEKIAGKPCDAQKLSIYADIPKENDYKLAIILTPENVLIKQNLIKRLVADFGKNIILAINTESISLYDLLQGSDSQVKLIGLNWTEPAHTTFFLEIISAEDPGTAEMIKGLAKSYWGKDPYMVKNKGIRSLLISAMAREASFLVDNGYASVDDIDRACRNDAGYYLPFAGNCRYMDLMGTYAYGMVMKDLNPDLSKDTELPNFFKQIMESGGLGMENHKGFYSYSEEDVDNWKRTMEEFSYQIQSMIEKYPFNYNKAPFTD